MLLKNLNLKLVNRFIFALFLLLILPFACANEKSQIIKLSDDGAWSWFQDPRAVYLSGKYKKTYLGWVTRTGKLQVSSYDHITKKQQTVTVRNNWGNDDHNVNSFLILPDNRLMIFYSGHNAKGLYAKISLEPESISEWSKEIVISNTNRITYSHPVFLKNENTFYVFWRGDTWKPSFATSKDGYHWTKEKILITDHGLLNKNNRPYLKLVSDGLSEIHFIFTNNHPNAKLFNSVYYMKYKKQNFYKANGDLIGDFKSLPFTHQKADIVYDSKKSGVKAWIWDVALNKKKYPVIVYTLFPEMDDHRYQYATWNGSYWISKELASAGNSILRRKWYQRNKEPYYSGGASIDKYNSNVVYLSRKVNNFFEIEKWVTENSGASWRSEAITANSAEDNIRPVVPFGKQNNESVIWMSGVYKHYTNFYTKILMNTRKSD